MKLSIDHKLIKRNQTISQVILYTSLGLLVLGLLWSIKSPTSNDVTITYLVLIPAYVLVQISIFMANKWGRSPRPDEIVASSLKGLNNQYTLYNYTTKVPHLLVGPAGIWIIKTYHHTGDISYDSDKNKYKQKGGPGFLAKTFAQEGLPNISIEDEKALQKFDKYMQANGLTTEEKPQVVNIFFSDEVDLHVKDAPEKIMLAGKLKDFIRQTAKKVNLSEEKIEQITKQLPEVTD
jgi:hypothetical protein